MTKIQNATNDTKKIFGSCGTCSHTFFHLLNREFGHFKDNEERASDLLAGGLKKGFQCGMLWGATLAAGAEAARKYKDKSQAISATVTASRYIFNSFTNRTKTPDCSQITGCNMSRFSGMVKFILKSLKTGLKNNICFNLAEEWTQDAIVAAKDGLSVDKTNYHQIPLNCACEVAKKMGASDEEMVMVAGFAGGIGLSGHACGALAACIWLKNLDWCKKHPGKNPPYFMNQFSKNILQLFSKETNGTFHCCKIAGKYFTDISDHTEFIKNGGCKNIIDVLANS